MSESKQIRSYIRWFKTTQKIIVLVLFLAFIGCFCMLMKNSGTKDPDPVKMDAVQSEIGNYVYVDVVGVSDWIYQVGKNVVYYALEDTEGDFYIASIPAEDFARLSAQNRYFEEDGPLPEAIRLTGVCKKTTDAVRSAVIEAYVDLSEDDFDAIFGSRFIDVGNTPKKSTMDLWMPLALISLVTPLVLLLVAWAKGRQEKKALKRLEQRGLLNQAESDIASPTIRSEKKDSFRMSSRFLFGKGMGLAAAWDDVLWCFESVTRYNFVVAYRKLVICTVDGVRHEHFFKHKQQDEIVAVMEYIQQQNPNAMIGYTLDNARDYREAVKRNK